MPLYAYGLMRARDARQAAQDRTESTTGAPAVRAIEHQGLAALVSEVPEGPMRVRRENLTGHVEVLQQAFRHGPVLPLRFGMALADAQSLERDLLSRDTARLLARLDALDGRAEMQLKVSYLEEPLLRSILAGDPRLAEASERTRSLPAEATHFERIRLGEAIAAAVEARRAADSQRLLDTLSPLAVAAVVGDLQHERMALNASFLVEKEALKRFDSAVEDLSRTRANEMEFKLIGPLPAHSFADRDWEVERSAQGSQGVRA